MEKIRTAVVKEVKASAVKKNTFYITVSDGFGDIKIVAKKDYTVGTIVRIKRRTPIDWIWDIVKEGN